MTGKDFYIIKVRFCTSNYYLKKFHNQESIGIKKQYEAAGAYNKFFWEFIEKVNGKKPTDYYKYYFSAGSECAIEDIGESHGINVIESGGWCKTFMIPRKNNEELFEWFKDNSPNYKVISRTCSWWYDMKPETWKREVYRMSPEMIERLKDI